MPLERRHPRIDAMKALTLLLVACIVPCAHASMDEGSRPGGVGLRVIDDTLASTEGDPIVVEDGRLLIFDHPGGVPKVVPASKVIGIAVGAVADRDTTPAERSAIRRAGDDAVFVEPYIEFIDGQRLKGDIHPGEDGEVVWRSAWIRDLPFDLEDIRAIRFEQGARVGEAVDADVVILSNGDELRGLVDAVGREVVVEVDGPAGGEPRRIEVPIHRVASIALVNPPMPVEGAMTLLRGGHRIASRGVRIGDDGYLRLVEPLLGGPVAEVPLEFLVSSVFQSSRIVPLARMPVEIGPGGAAGLRPWIPPVEVGAGHHPFDAAPIELSGPMRADFSLPAGPNRVKALFERPSDAGRGRVVVVVFDGDIEIERHVLDGDDPTVRIAVPVTSGVLGIEIEDGGDGPYRDAVIVREAIVVRPGG